MEYGMVEVKTNKGTLTYSYSKGSPIGDDMVQFEHGVNPLLTNKELEQAQELVEKEVYQN